MLTLAQCDQHGTCLLVFTKASWLEQQQKGPTGTALMMKMSAQAEAGCRCGARRWNQTPRDKTTLFASFAG